uniref:Pectate lyase superfamily protein domain-containing protein n=1 Tax=Solibacter usitatus (strain Ellin6076) TaxID=234267 RepID=Q023R4_SOLUE
MLAACALHAQALSEWAFGGPDHRLYYRTDPRGNQLMDFSFAGYRAGGVALPSPATAQRFTPIAGDNTARIQAALDCATGAVVLASGDYEIGGTLSITRSGVVLRGEKGAAIRITGKPHAFLEIRGAGTWHEEGPRVPILDPYVPAGATSFRVRDAAAFHPGDHVLVLHLVPAETLGAVSRTDRVIDSVNGDRITLDVPLSNALDGQFNPATLVRYTFPGRITEVGVENLRISAPSEDEYPAVRIDAAEDAWARDLEIRESHNGIVIGPGAKRLTLANVRITHSTPHSGSAESADFSLEGTQILLDRGRVTGDGISPVVTRAEAAGPLVILNFIADRGGVAPHQPWATGLLVDGGKFPGATEARPGVSFSTNTAWSVAWNVVSPYLLVQQPPAAQNWCVGCVGRAVTIGSTPNGIFDSPGKMVDPASLYLHQLHDRLGPDALRNIGYSSY